MGVAEGGDAIPCYLIAHGKRFLLWDAGVSKRALGNAHPVAKLDRTITDQLAQGGRVELRGFGAFSSRQRDARVGRNPRTGEAVDVDAKRVPYFKPGKEMRERLNLQDVTAE